MAKYILKFSIEYFENRFPQWFDVSDNDRKKLVDKEFENIAEANKNDKNVIITVPSEHIEIFKVEDTDTIELQKPENF